LDVKDKSDVHVLYVATKAPNQARTIYLAFDYSGVGDDVSAIRVIDGASDKKDKCAFIPNQIAAKAAPQQGPQSDIEEEKTKQAKDGVPATQKPLSTPEAAAQSAASMPPASSAQPNPAIQTVVPQGVKLGKQGEFARLTEIPTSCQAARELGPQLSVRDPFTGRGAPTPACSAILDCRMALVLQVTSIINYLNQHSSVIDALRSLRITGTLTHPQQDGLFRELAEKLRSFGEDITGSNCGYERMIIDREWLSLNPNSGSKRTFEVLVTAGQTLLNKLRSDFNVEEEEYRDLSAFNDRYARARPDHTQPCRHPPLSLADDRGGI
jgi:hypothetical protein